MFADWHHHVWTYCCPSDAIWQQMTSSCVNLLLPKWCHMAADDIIMCELIVAQVMPYGSRWHHHVWTYCCPSDAIWQQMTSSCVNLLLPKWCHMAADDIIMCELIVAHVMPYGSRWHRHVWTYCCPSDAIWQQMTSSCVNLLLPKWCHMAADDIIMCELIVGQVMPYGSRWHHHVWTYCCPSDAIWQQMTSSCVNLLLPKWCHMAADDIIMCELIVAQVMPYGSRWRHHVWTYCCPSDAIWQQMTSSCVNLLLPKWCHMAADVLVITSSSKDLLLIRHQTITWTNSGVLVIFQ